MQHNSEIVYSSLKFGFLQKAMAKTMSFFKGVPTAPPTPPPCVNQENDFMCKQLAQAGVCQYDDYKYYKCRHACGCHGKESQ